MMLYCNNLTKPDKISALNEPKNTKIALVKMATTKNYICISNRCKNTSYYNLNHFLFPFTYNFFSFFLLIASGFSIK